MLLNDTFAFSPTADKVLQQWSLFLQTQGSLIKSVSVIADKCKNEKNFAVLLMNQTS